MNLSEIDQEQALSLTKFFISNDQNIFLFGAPGVGKTQISLKAISDLKLKINYVNLSTIDRTDLAGYPDMFAEGDIVTFKSPYFLPKLKSGKPNSIIIFDEIDKADPSVLSPLHEILVSKSINGQKINAKACILTGNLPEHNSYSNEISKAILDRGAKFILKYDFEKWIDWAKANYVNDLILGFLRCNDKYSYKESFNSYAFPTPRGWTEASKAINSAKDKKINDIETISLIISGFVGKEASIAFSNWYLYYRKYEKTINLLLNSPTIHFNFEGLSPAEKIVFVISLCSEAKLKSINSGDLIYLSNLCDVFKELQIPDELQTISIFNSFDFELITKHKFYECNKFFEFFKELKEKVKKSIK